MAIFICVEIPGNCHQMSTDVTKCCGWWGAPCPPVSSIGHGRPSAPGRDAINRATPRDHNGHHMRAIVAHDNHVRVIHCVRVVNGITVTG